MGTLKPGGILGGQVFKIEDGAFTYKNAYGKRANVPVAAIETVAVTPTKGGKANLLVIGAGATLATIELPAPWAEKAQKWLLTEIGK